MINDLALSYVRFFILSLSATLICIDLNSQNDSSMNHEEKSKSYSIGAGYISAGYNYGLTPFSMIDSTVGGYFTLEGNQQVQVLNAPINISGRYTTLKNVSGLNNSIHVSFDVNAYKEQLKQQAKAKALSYKDSILNIRNLEQQYTKQLYYLQYLNSLPEDQYQKKISKPVVADSAMVSAQDSLPNVNPVSAPSIPQLTLPQGPAYKQELNSLIEKQRTILDSIRTLRSQLQVLQVKSDSIADLRNKELEPSVGLPKLSAIRNFEVGLCYPMHSPLSLYGIPLRGINTEFETNKFYFSLAAGRTISNLLFTNDLLQNNLNNVRNLYNFFDFNNPVAGRTIAAVRLGAGRKENSHVHFGFLWGKGLESYWQDSTTALNTQAVEQNLVADIEAAFNIATNHQISFNYAKSVLKSSLNENENNSETAQKLTDVNYRSHAAQVKYSGKFPAMGTSLTGALRWIDPYFKSYGAGFVRPDNLRYEIKVSQNVGRKWIVALQYRQESNNLINLYDYRMILRSAGANVTYKSSSRLQMRAAYYPVVQQIQTDTMSSFNDNQMANASVMWRPKTGKLRTTIGVHWNYCKLTDGSVNREYNNLLTNVRFQGKNGWHVGVNYAFYNVSPQDTLLMSGMIVTGETGYQSKKGWQVSGGLKAGQFASSNLQTGYFVQLSLPLFKGATLVAEGQKLIRGDFYNLYSEELFNTFPYLITTRLQINWQ
jgi:hypothetical protein